MSTVSAENVTTHPLPDLDDRQALVHTPAGTALLGHRCDDCGTLAFPIRAACGACSGRSLTEVPLSTTGQLYSFTTVHVSSSRPTPYTLGYVDLADGVRVLSLVDGDPAGLEMDAPVHLTHDDAGSWAFSAVAAQNGDHDA